MLFALVPSYGSEMISCPGNLGMYESGNLNQLCNSNHDLCIRVGLTEHRFNLYTGFKFPHGMNFYCPYIHMETSCNSCFCSSAGSKTYCSLRRWGRSGRSYLSYTCWSHVYDLRSINTTVQLLHYIKKRKREMQEERETRDAPTQLTSPLVVGMH